MALGALRRYANERIFRDQVYTALMYLSERVDELADLEERVEALEAAIAALEVRVRRLEMPPVEVARSYELAQDIQVVVS